MPDEAAVIIQAADRLARSWWALQRSLEVLHLAVESRRRDDPGKAGQGPAAPVPRPTGDESVGVA